MVNYYLNNKEVLRCNNWKQYYRVIPNLAILKCLFNQFVKMNKLNKIIKIYGNKQNKMVKPLK